MIGRAAVLRPTVLNPARANVERYPVRPFEDLNVLKRKRVPFLALAHPSSVVCILFSDTQSFGSWLEPRYIFGAETLV